MAFWNAKDEHTRAALSAHAAQMSPMKTTAAGLGPDNFKTAEPTNQTVRHHEVPGVLAFDSGG